MIDLSKISDKKGIYEFYHPSDGKRYFGMSFDSLRGRISDHKTDKAKDYFHNAIRCHGWDSFEVNILHEFDEITNDELLWIEANYIECYETYKEENGYNILRYGSCRIGYKHSEKTCEKMSKSQKLKYENGYINPNLGTKVSEKSKQKRLKTITENKTYVGENHPMFGKKHSEKSKEQMSKIRIEKDLSKGENNPMFGIHRYDEEAPNFGKKHTDETKNKIKLANSKQIKQIDKITNEIIKIWNSATEAAIYFNLKNPSPITSVLKKRAKISCGFKWEYV